MISIIIPVLNEEKALPRTLANVLAQKGEKEIIVVDGGSTDSTRAIANDATGLKLLSSGKGRARQMNTGAKQAGGEWLLFLHADTLLPVDALTGINALEDGIGAGCFLHRFSEGHWFLKIISWLHNWRFTKTRVIYGDQAMFVRRELFQKIGGFPEEPILEDVYFSEKLNRQTQPVQLDKTVITDSRKFLERGVWKSFMQVILIQLHCRFHLPLLARGFFSPVR